MSLVFSSSQVYRPVVVLPIALALLAASAAILWINLAHEERAGHNGIKTALSIQPATIGILVSRVEVPRGQLLGAGDVLVKPVSPANSPAGALSRPEDAEGHLALVSIAAGTPILKTAVSGNVVQGLSARVPDSYRAFALPVSESSIAGGFIESGDRVDLYVTLPGALFTDASKESRSDRSKAAMLLQSIEVLAVGTKLERDDTPHPSVRTVTLAVPVADLAKLALAARLGNVSLAIRNPADTQSAPQSQAELTSLVAPAADASPSPESMAPKARRRISLLAGRNQTLLPVP